MALRNHLGSDEHDAIGGREACERGGHRAWTLDRIGVEANPLQLRNLCLELALEPLRPRAEPGELRRSACATRLGLTLRVAAVMAAEEAVGVQHERDVAVGAPERRAASAAVQRRRDPAAVEKEDRLAAPVGDRAELGEQRG